MIRFLQGTLLFHEEKRVILSVQGVGYEIYTPNPEQFEAQNMQSFFIHTHVREDALVLFGFEDKQGLDFFEMLLKVNGVGPKMALAIMSMPLEKLVQALSAHDEKTLSSIAGVGKKLAQRLILELEPKNFPFAGLATTDTSRKTQKSHEEKTQHNEALEALEALGYKTKAIQKKLDSIEGEFLNTEALIFALLQQM